jgi:hypothetical protein
MLEQNDADMAGHMSSWWRRTPAVDSIWTPWPPLEILELEIHGLSSRSRWTFFEMRVGGRGSSIREKWWRRPVVQQQLDEGRLVERHRWWWKSLPNPAWRWGWGRRLPIPLVVLSAATFRCNWARTGSGVATYLAIYILINVLLLLYLAFSTVIYVTWCWCNIIKCCYYVIWYCCQIK